MIKRIVIVFLLCFANTNFVSADTIEKEEKTMKIMSLNIWGGQIKEPLIEFFHRHKDVDIFCMQEVYYKAKNKACTNDDPVQLDILSDISSVLPSHSPFFIQTIDGYGIAMLIKKELVIQNKGEYLIHENPNYTPPGPTHSRKLQWVEINANGSLYTVVNLHGLWNGRGKSDSDARIIQSKNIKKFIDGVNGKKILCGDFNITPDTKSMAIIEDGMQNLVKIYGVKSTRTSFYNKPIKYADYFFTSKDIEIKTFKVLKDEVSDHAPLLLEIYN